MRRRHEGPSPREMQVLALAAAGHPNKVIADKLGTSQGTVKNQLVSVYRKLNVETRLQATLWYLNHTAGGPKQ